MRTQKEPPRERPERMLTRLASASPYLLALSDWLDLPPEARNGDGPSQGKEAFTAEQQERAKARDLADRRAMAGRDILAREPEAFELQGRNIFNWHAETAWRGGGARAWMQSPKRKVGDVLRVEELPGSPANITQAYVVIVVRIDRAGRKLCKLLCPRFPENGPIPADEEGATNWALIPSVDSWGTRCDEQPAAQTAAAGARDRRDNSNGGER